MGILTCAPLPCRRSQTNSSDHLQTDHSNSSSLSSQLSLPSIPSLSSSPSQSLSQIPTADHRCIATLRGHASSVISLSLGGKFLYSGSSDTQIRIWPRVEPPADSNNDKNNVVAAADGAAVKSLTVLGDKLFSGHQDNRIRVWRIDAAAGGKLRLLVTLPTVGDRLRRLLSPASYVQVRRHKKCTWVHHVDAVSALAVSTDGSDLLYSASWDRSFKVWRAGPHFTCLESVSNAHDDAINAVAVSGDGFVYTGSADKKIKVWKRGPTERKHAQVACLEKHRSAVNALALSADGCVLYSGACDRSIIVWERCGGGSGGGGEHMVVVGALRGHTKAILCLAAVAGLVCSGSADGTVRVWKRSGEGRSYYCVAVLEGHKGPVKCLAAAADGGKTDEQYSSYVVYSGSLDCDVRVWQISVPKAL